MRVVVFSGQVAASSTVTERYRFASGPSCRVRRLELRFNQGQAGVVYHRPRIERPCGTIDDLFYPDPEVTGGGWSCVVQGLPVVFEPGAVFRMDIRNTSPDYAYQYAVLGEFEEVV